MKKVLLLSKAFLTLLLFMSTTLTSFSQNNDYDGIWAGNIEYDDGDIAYSAFIIEDGVAKIIVEQDGELYTQSHDIDVTEIHGSQLTFFWMNEGGVWTETQLYIFSFIDEETVSVKFIRRVNNCPEDEECEAWGYTAEGTLYLLEE